MAGRKQDAVNVPEEEEANDIASTAQAAMEVAPEQPTKLPRLRKQRSRSAEPYKKKKETPKTRCTRSLQQIKLEEAVEDAITGRIIFHDGGAEKPGN